MALKWPDKDPQAIKDYGLDWAALLAAGETITDSTWAIAPTGELTATDESILGSVAIVWLSGGVSGTAYAATNTVTTSRGMSDQRTVAIKAKEQ